MSPTPVVTARDPELAQPISLGWANVREDGHAAEDVVVDLYQRIRPTLVAYAYRLIGNHADAEDLVQTAFVRVFRQLRRKAAIQNPKSWLFSVVHNLAIDHVRREGKREWITQAWLEMSAGPTELPSPEEEFLKRQQVEQSLLLLSDRERHCLLLRAEGLSYAEIGEVLRISEKAVSAYLARGLKKVGTPHADR